MRSLLDLGRMSAVFVPSGVVVNLAIAGVGNNLNSSLPRPKFKSPPRTSGGFLQQLPESPLAGSRTLSDISSLRSDRDR